MFNKINQKHIQRGTSAVVAVVALYFAVTAFLEYYNFRAVAKIAKIDQTSNNPKIVEPRVLQVSIERALADIDASFKIHSQSIGLTLETGRTVVDQNTATAQGINIDAQCRSDGIGVIVGNQCCVSGYCTTQTSSFVKINECTNDSLFSVTCPDNRLLSGTGVPSGFVDGTDDCSNSLCFQFVNNPTVSATGAVFNFTDFQATCNNHYFTDIDVNCPTFETGATVPAGYRLNATMSLEIVVTRTIEVSNYKFFDKITCTPKDFELICRDAVGSTIGSLVYNVSYNLTYDGDDMAKLFLDYVHWTTMFDSTSYESSLQVDGFEVQTAELGWIAIITSSLGVFSLVGLFVRGQKAIFDWYNKRAAQQKLKATGDDDGSVTLALDDEVNEKMCTNTQMVKIGDA